MAEVLLDASVIVPVALADTLLRAAATRLYEVVWSDDILAEVRRNLVEDGLSSEEGARRRIAAMRGAFPRATVHGYHERIDSMTNHAKDRHVLAAAVVARASTIVTSNRRHFPRQALVPHGIEALTPDEFLIRLDDVDHAAMTAILRRQAADLRRPPMAVREILTNLAIHAPTFAARFAAELDAPED
jgi:predicted nucleic acid-binding protein